VGEDGVFGARGLWGEVRAEQAHAPTLAPQAHLLCFPCHHYVSGMHQR
jgi:hypothetical protein